MDSLHSPDMAGRCFKCGEQVGTDLRGCKAPPYKSPREIELERENAKLREQLETARNTIHHGGTGCW